MVKSVRFLLLLIAFVSMQIVAWGQPQERLVQVHIDLLVASENPALAEECVHERGLAVVNVSNDGDITKLFVTNEIFQESILMEIGRTRPEGQAGKRGASTMTESVSVHRFALLRKRL